MGYALARGKERSPVTSGLLGITALLDFRITP
jgi:hypothetical protein